MSLTFSHCLQKGRRSGRTHQSCELDIFLGSGEKLDLKENQRHVEGDHISSLLHQKRSNILGPSPKHSRVTVGSWKSPCQSPFTPLSVWLARLSCSPLHYAGLPFTMLIINSPGSGSFIPRHWSRAERLPNELEIYSIFGESRWGD